MAMTVEGGARTQDAEASPAAAIDARALGERLGRYQLVEPLAQGGMGLVFAGRLLGAHGVERLVAIKTLRPITSASDRAALLREARLTSRLHHRNVVATLDLGEVDDVPYVVMELVDGVSLSRLLTTLQEANEPIGVELAAWIVMQAAHGLHAAHELTDAEGRKLGLVHRDVSPQNILLSMSGDVKLADFGIAKFAGRDESTATGMIKGKFGYMSPEQASAGAIDRRSDVFALGIVLWEALTQQKLFASNTPARTILRVIEHQPEAPSVIRPDIGDEISQLIMRCLAKDPAARFPTAAAFGDALRSALRARPTAIDEADLAATIERLFGQERRVMMDRLRSEPLGEATPDSLSPSPSPGGADASSVAVSRSTPRPRGRSRRALGAALVVLVGAGAWFVARRGPPEPAPSDVSAHSASAPAESAAAETVPSVTPPTAVPSPGTTAPASSDSTASVASST
jgi:serine/threonine-protein kinase